MIPGRKRRGGVFTFVNQSPSLNRQQGPCCNLCRRKFSRKHTVQTWVLTSLSRSRNITTRLTELEEDELQQLPGRSAERMQAHLQTSSPSSTQPVPAARLPCRVKVTAGKRYAWCACGHSQKQPYCDGAHRTKAPSISPLRFTPEKDQTVMLCACKQTKNAPYCDGSHFKVIFQDVVKSVKGVFK
uniref:CDGSH iron-sulfur domain-containing protein 3, mitochondrial-like n=1 Tax=Labrus bergylta TaxID=56723 RepID=A0A3Q3MN46_9LABR